MKNEVEFMVRCSYLEIYQEEIKDLLNPETPPKSIHIREVEKKGIVVVGVKEEVVTTYEDMKRFVIYKYDGSLQLKMS